MLKSNCKNMNKLSVKSLENCELGCVAAEETCVSDNRQQCVSSPALVRGILIVILFNICLAIFVYLLYIFLNNLSDNQRSKAITAVCSSCGILLCITLLNLGDLSTQHPNFYYI